MATGWMFWRADRPKVNLIFRWRPAHGFSFRLVFFLFLSLACHFAAFYVFKVVYPPNKKNLPRDAGVWLLPMDDPQVKALLARHSASLGAFGAVAPEPEESAVALVPARLTTEGHQLGFLPLPPSRFAFPLVFPDAADAGLPPVAAGETAAPARPADARQGAVLQWVDEAGTVRTSSAGIRVSQGTGDEADSSGWVFRVAIDRHGRVKEAALLRGSGDARDALLRRAILALYAPDELPRPAPGTLAWFTLHCRPAHDQP